MIETNVMLDLETLGNTPGSVICAIGAVKFGGGQIQSEFYHRIDRQSCIAAGLTMDLATVEWWMRQSDAARQELVSPGVHLRWALEAFAVWIGGASVAMWGNGAAFDNVVLRAAYDALGLRAPWMFYHDRCYRTLKNLFPGTVMERSGVHHHALDDARSQALHLMRFPIYLEDSFGKGEPE